MYRSSNNFKLKLKLQVELIKTQQDLSFVLFLFGFFL